jgi:threonine/homoserine/homoserine lactone efflux protein
MAVEAMLPGGALGLLLNFAVGYLAVNAVPGPSTMAIGSLAALRGLRGALPLILGIACGTAALAAALNFAYGVLAGAGGLESAGRAAGGVLLLLVAMRAAVTPNPAAAGAPARGGASARAALLAFGAGFATAASNPISGAYFLAQFLGPVGEAGAGSIAVLLVLAQALAWSTLVAVVFAQPAVRRFAAAHHRLVCVASGAALALLASVMLGPLLLA